MTSFIAAPDSSRYASIRRGRVLAGAAGFAPGLISAALGLTFDIGKPRRLSGFDEDWTCLSLTPGDLVRTTVFLIVGFIALRRGMHALKLRAQAAQAQKLRALTN